MGGICVKFNAARYHMPDSKFDNLFAVCKRFGINRKIVDDFYRVFRKIDITSTGKITLLELLDFLKQENTPFFNKAFGLLDSDKSGDLDFFEFVVNIYHYCTYDWQGLVGYCFDLNDTSGDGSLDVQEVEGMIKDLFGKELDSRVKSILRKMDDDGSGTISKSEFTRYSRQFPVLMFPAFLVQEAMRKKVFGPGFWQKHTYRLRQEGKMKLQEDETMVGILSDIMGTAKKEYDKEKKSKKVVPDDAAWGKQEGVSGSKGGKKAGKTTTTPVEVIGYGNKGGAKKRKSNDGGSAKTQNNGGSGSASSNPKKGGGVQRRSSQTQAAKRKTPSDKSSRAKGGRKGR
jgi:Ca2+-binding EF-hand superfamily protein